MSGVCPQDLNALPFAVTVANTIVWLVYGLLKHDPFVMSSNVPGLPAAMFCTMSVYGLVDEKVCVCVRQCAKTTIAARKVIESSPKPGNVHLSWSGGSNSDAMHALMRRSRQIPAWLSRF